MMEKGTGLLSGIDGPTVVFGLIMDSVPLVKERWLMERGKTDSLIRFPTLLYTRSG